MDIIVRAENISKCFYSDIFFRKSGEEKQVLHRINFCIRKGEKVGIVGKNGAGKSTLLKILSGLFEPNEGTLQIKGSICGIVELSNAFHPELSGMDNLRFQAVLMGYSQGELAEKTQQIIEFAELKEAIHKPLNTYSSGMIARLAFSIAVHTSAEILVLDEVLAVGDVFFQQKCIGFLNSQLAADRTIILVSHQTELIRKLCSRVLFLENGRLVADGKTDEVISNYLGLQRAHSGNMHIFNSSEKKEGFSFLSWKEPLLTNTRLILEIGFLLQKTRDLDIGININDARGICLIHLSNRFIHQKIIAPAGESLLEVSIQNQLLPGTYFLTLFMRDGDEILHWLQNIAQFTLKGSAYDTYENPSEIKGFIQPQFTITFRT